MRIVAKRIRQIIFCILAACGLFALLLKWLGQFLPEGM